MYGLTLNKDLTILGNAFSTILNTYGINKLEPSSLNLSLSVYALYIL